MRGAPGYRKRYFAEAQLCEVKISLIGTEKSLFSPQKVPVPMSREFGCNYKPSKIIGRM
jgi:hypothetical protein